jgi:hypothetical protein
MDNELNVRGELRILRLGVKPVEWLIPKTHGITPQPRTNSTLNFHESLNILVLYGGQNNRTGAIFDDISMFDLDSSTWYSVIIYDDLPSARFDHSSVIYDNMLFVFGGMGNNHILGSDIYAANMGNCISYHRLR